jgi:acyl-CoA synthetase (NDP forming)
VREGIGQGAARSPVPTLVTSTLPELLDDEAAATFIAAGVPAIAGLTAGLRCALALEGAPGLPARLREIGAAHAAGAAARETGDGGTAGAWLAEHEAKDLLRAAGVTVAPGRAVTDEDDAVAAADEAGWPVAIKLSSALLQHKTEAGALALGITGEAGLRDEYRRIAAIDGGGEAAVLVEAMATGEAELLIAARRDAVVPALVVAVGGVWTEVLADAAVIPLPATPERVVRAIHSLRAAPLLTGGRGRTPLAVEATATLAALAGDVLLAENLELLELNPVILGRESAVAVDALARRCAVARAPMSPPLEEARV